MNHAVQSPIDIFTFNPGQAPLVFSSKEPSIDLVNWAMQQRDHFLPSLRKVGAVLFRGFKLGSPQRFEMLIRKTMGEPIHYTYASTPRTKVMSKIYTSTEYPAHLSIPLHNEMAYTQHWPRFLFFYCHTPALKGGQTPIADSRKVYKSISSETRAMFEKKKLKYVRNYDGFLDLSWQKTFSTSSRAEVEARCQKMGISLEWLSEDHLRTSEVCDAIVHHPETGEPSWFNQAHLFHISAQEEDIRKVLLANGEENLPRNVYFGDGQPIPDEMLQEVRSVLDSQQIVFDWKKGDVLLVDNLLCAHGRLPFEGAKRKILVGMTA